MEPKPSPKADWTVMVYFAADNDLEDAALANLQMMKKVGSSPQVHILAQLDTRQSNQTFRYRLRDEKTLLEEDVEVSLNEINTGDPHELADFIRWGWNNYPAHHYLLVIWGHGTGWDDVEVANRAAKLTTNPVFKPSQTRTYSLSPKGEWRVYLAGEKPATLSFPSGKHGEFFKQLTQEASPTLPNEPIGPAVAWDDALPEIAQKSQDALKLKELGKALGAGLRPDSTWPTPPASTPPEKIDLLGMDACLMGSTEVAFQVCDYANYLIASQDVVPRDSWPYDRILARLRENPQMRPEELAVWVVREYLMHYKGQNKDVTQAVINLQACEPLRHAVAALAEDLTEQLRDRDKSADTNPNDSSKVRAEVMLARTLAQTFYLKNHVDLFDFCLHLQKYSSDPGIRQKCQAVMDALYQFRTAGKGRSLTLLPSQKTFVFEYGACGYRLRKAKGASIYFPALAPSATYRKNAFNKQTHWLSFLTELARPFEERVAILRNQSPTTSKEADSLDTNGNKTREGTIDKTREGTIDKTREGTIDKTREGTIDKTREGTIDKTREGTIDKTREGTIDKTREGTIDKTREGTIDKIPMRPDFTIPSLFGVSADPVTVAETAPAPAPLNGETTQKDLNQLLAYIVLKQLAHSLE